MKEQQVIKLLQSLSESDRAVYLPPNESYIGEERVLELTENVALEFKVIAHCDYMRVTSVTDETGRHKYEYVPVSESIEVHSPKIYIYGDFSFELKEDITKYFILNK